MDSDISNHEPGSMESAAGPMRASQRQPMSCTECTRRKTRCDKQVPCQHCRKRGIPELCRIEQVVPTKNLVSAAQLKSLRDETIAANAQLTKRVAELEKMVQACLADQKNAAPRGGDGILPAPHLAASVSPFPLTSTAAVPQNDVVTQEMDGSVGGNDDDEAEAAATLEFLAIGRLRAQSPGGLHDDGQWAPESDSVCDSEVNLDSNASLPMGRMDNLVQVPAIALSMNDSSQTAQHLTPVQPYRPDRRRLSAYRQAVRAEILAHLPPAAVGRALVQYDIENVSWMHCCYHGPTFQSESDLFWAELGSDDVEINWNFLALLYGVLMSGAYHLPPSTFSYLFPLQKPLELIGDWFEACKLCLQEADWMRSHSLYAVQCIAVIATAATHIGKSDYYFTLLGAAIRVAQALNLHRLGPDSHPMYQSRNSKLIIAREVRKRTWYQLVYQDAFHVAFNGSCSINMAHFNTPPPLHCIDDKLGSGVDQAEVALTVPTMDSHVSQLHKIALQLNRAYSSTDHMAPLPYDTLLKIDNDMQVIRDEAPEWMRNESFVLDPGMPPWADWQRKAYILSASHKVIVLHRPYLGRAFRGDTRFIRSREICLDHANKILRIFKECTLHQFRTTWTVLVHVVAANLVLLLEASQHKNPSVVSSMKVVRETTVALQGLTDFSVIAKKGFLVLSALIEDSTQLAQAGQSASAQDRHAFQGKAEIELKRALDVFRRGQPVLPPPSATAFGVGVGVGVGVGAGAGISGGLEFTRLLGNQVNEDLINNRQVAEQATRIPVGPAAAPIEAAVTDQEPITFDPFLWISQPDWVFFDPAIQGMDLDNAGMEGGGGQGWDGMDWMAGS